jgi:hypothetical protein
MHAPVLCLGRRAPATALRRLVAVRCRSSGGSLALARPGGAVGGGGGCAGAALAVAAARRRGEFGLGRCRDVCHAPAGPAHGIVQGARRGESRAQEKEGAPRHTRPRAARRSAPSRPRPRQHTHHKHTASTAAAAAAAPDAPSPSPIAAYLATTAAVPAPPCLDALVRLLAAQGLTPADPAARAGLHPLVIPLAAGPPDALTGWAPAAGGGAASPSPTDDPLPGSPPHTTSTSAPVVVGLLRWAAPPDAAAGRGLPVVLTAPGSPRLTLLARSAEEYVHRSVAEEDAAGGGEGPWAAAVGPDDSPYQPGDVPAGTPLASPAFDAHLVRRVGAFPDVAERLIARHLAKPDTMSALITGEWYMRKGAFPGWARPYESVARVYASLGRREEARDCARAALALPWWGLEHGFAAAARLAELPPSPAGVRDALAAAERGAGGPTAVPVSARTDAQVALEAAAAAFDDVAGSDGGNGSGAVDWGAAVEPAAEALERAGLAEVANFVRAARAG